MMCNPLNKCMALGKIKRPSTIKRRTVIALFCAITLLLQSFTSSFQMASAGMVDGYMDTTCTLHGATKTIFVAYENDKNKDSHDCLKCPACIIQSKLASCDLPQQPSLNTRFVVISKQQPFSVFEAFIALNFQRPLSRAPPV